ncbi:MAG: hypothetical protein QG670_1866 [Thermoproteota archaeon]|nr:hypothetical protein [Thermoproteota archaeon]
MSNRNEDNKADSSLFRHKLDKAARFGEVYEIVKETVRHSLGKHRVGMMLYLDDLPLQVGAYHPVGTNSIIMNRALLRIVEATVSSKQLVNAFVYTILLHEYIHSIGYLQEETVRRLVQKVSLDCFGEDHPASRLSRMGPWSLLRGVPLKDTEAPQRVMEIVKDFERSNQSYIS